MTDINKELLGALKAIVEKEDVETHGWYSDEFAHAVCVIARAEAVLNAESCKQELTSPESGINNSMKITNVSQDVSNSKIVVTFKDPRDEQIRILREGLVTITRTGDKVSMIKTANRTLAAADKLNGGE